MKNLFNSLKKIEWIIIFVMFFMIPTLCGIIVFHVGMMTTVGPLTLAVAWNFLLICITGTNLLMSFAFGGIVLAIPIMIYLIAKIKNTPWM